MRLTAKVLAAPLTRRDRCVFAPRRWLDVSVANLTCSRYWVAYLQVIQEAVWPRGHLPAAPPSERSQQQKEHTRREALRSLMALLPGKDANAAPPCC